jgi:hypothetical protein
VRYLSFPCFFFPPPPSRILCFHFAFSSLSFPHHLRVCSFRKSSLRVGLEGLWRYLVHRRQCRIRSTEEGFEGSATFLFGCLERAHCALFPKPHKADCKSGKRLHEPHVPAEGGREILMAPFSGKFVPPEKCMSGHVRLLLDVSVFSVFHSAWILSSERGLGAVRHRHRRLDSEYTTSRRSTPTTTRETGREKT